MRLSWWIVGAAVIVAAIVVWALVPDAGTAQAAPSSTDGAGSRSATRPASRPMTREVLATTRIVPRAIEGRDAEPLRKVLQQMQAK